MGLVIPGGTGGNWEHVRGVLRRDDRPVGIEDAGAVRVPTRTDSAPEPMAPMASATTAARLMNEVIMVMFSSLSGRSSVPNERNFDLEIPRRAGSSATCRHHRHPVGRWPPALVGNLRTFHDHRHLPLSMISLAGRTSPTLAPGACPELKSG